MFGEVVFIIIFFIYYSINKTCLIEQQTRVTRHTKAFCFIWVTNGANGMHPSPLVAVFPTRGGVPNVNIM